MFTPEQKQIIESFGKGQAVIAGAGCGKTTTLVAKCLALIAQNPKARFCAVSFTEKSVRDLKESLAEGFLKAGVYETRHSHWVKTIHGLCSTIIQEFPTEAGLQGGERILVEDESGRLWEKSINLLWSQNENEGISIAIEKLLAIYSKSTLEGLFRKLRSLKSFGVDEMIKKSFHREEVKNLWLCFESIYQRYHHYKIRDGALDFNDLEIYALAALQSNRVCKYYHERFDLILVDEYQDTNPIQGKILELFAKPSFNNFCVVGDPKQSIYRFRDADVSVFQDLTEKLPLKHLLDTNYRSRPEIIDFVNVVCAPAFQASQLSYEALKPGRAPAEEKSSRSLVSRLIIRNEGDLARFFIEEQKLGRDLSEYVILARSLRKDKTQRYLHALSSAGVPYLLGSGGRFFSDPRVQELVAFLKGFVSPKNVLSQVIALRSPWIAIPDETLLAWKDHYYEKFFMESEQTLALALKDTYLNFSRVRPGEILETLWKNDLLDEELLLPLVTLWHKAEQLSSQGLRFEEVVHSFSKAIDDDKLEKEIPPPAQKGAVRVLTIHGAKGLQFPRVVLLDFDGEYRAGGGSRDLIWDRKRGVHLFNRDEKGKKEAKDPENTAWEDLEKQSAVAESKRLFFVALTRAQEELILAWKEEVNLPAASKNPDFNPLIRDGWRGWVETSLLPAILDLPPEVINTNENDQHSLPLMPRYQALTLKGRVHIEHFRPRHSPSEWMILSQCNLRYDYRYWKSIQDEEKVARDYTAFENEQKSVGSGVASQIGEEFHAFIENEQWEELQEKLGESPVLTLKSYLNENVQVFKEFGFEVPLNHHEALVGMMDRLEVDEATKSIRIIDYKWTQKPKLEEELLAHYQLQLQLYVWATSKLISFVPERISASLIHICQNSVQKIELPAELLNLSEIETRVHALHQKVYASQGTEGEKTPTLPTRGEYCKYCEYQVTCPIFSST